MGQKKNNIPEENELYKSAHLMILLSYTLFSVILIGESFLMGWEKWAIVLIVAGVGGSWIMHIRRRFSDYGRLWIYSLLMMATYFFYGIHLTSTFDIALVMVVVIMIYTMSGVKPLIKLCVVTFFITFSYDIIVMAVAGENFDPLAISRSVLHICMVVMAAWVANTIMDKWKSVVGHSHEEIEVLKEQTDRLNHFLANVSHEIRTPINAVMGLSSVLEKENLPDDVEENISAISRAGHRVAEQMGDILDYTEIDMDKLSVSHENYMISSLINDVLAQLNFADDYGLDLIIDMEADIPAVLLGDADKIKKILWHLITNGYKFTKTGGVNVHLYSVKRSYGINLVLEVSDTGIGMDQSVLDHIYEGFYQSDSGHSRTAGGLGLGLPVVNGFVKAMGGVLIVESSPGEGTIVKISIPQTVIDPEPCLSVRERENCHVAGFLGFMTTGSAEVREFYMEMIKHLSIGLSIPFQRVQSMEELDRLVESSQITHLFVGTGEYLENREYIDTLSDRMNVAIVADRDFHGDIDRRLTLLAKPFYGGQVANFLNHAFEAGVFKDEEKMTCPGLKALVVDDEPMNLLVARGIFEAYGMIVSTAPGGEESIDMCHDNDYDIVFMDHMMPGMDGVEAMKRIRSDAQRSDKEILIVALTANAISSAKEMFLSEGFDGFVPKPIELSELERVLKRILPKGAIVYNKEISAERASRDKGTFVTSTITNDIFSALAERGVDTDSGVKYCNGDREFYKQVLAEYASKREEKIRALSELFESGDWQQYAIRIHAIKSTSRMIGADALSEIARRLEQAAKAGDEYVIKQKHPALMPQYFGLMDTIAQILDIREADSSSVSSEEEVLEFAPDEDGESDASEGGGL
ncbi:MAG: response regulator [Lachnospiraceae bacterium]|nr:response regulator [Lachnospiraceae bacterium]